VVLARQAFPASMIALWLEQAPPVLVVSEATQPCIHSVIVSEDPASAPHFTILTHPCIQRLVTLPALGDDEPQPCTAPSAKPATKKDPITQETDFLDIARYLLLVCERAEGITAYCRAVFRVWRLNLRSIKEIE
jgi:hypothetical protein